MHWHTKNLQEYLRVHAYKTRLKITQLEMVHFIKVIELKLTEVEVF